MTSLMMWIRVFTTVPKLPCHRRGLEIQHFIFRHGGRSNNRNLLASLVYQCRSPTSSTSRILKGAIPNPHIVFENGMKFLVKLEGS